MPLLLQVLKDSRDERERAAAARALGDSRDKTALEPLVQSLLFDPSPDVRKDSAEALRVVATYRVDVLKTLQEALKTERDATQRRLIEEAIAKIQKRSHQ